MIIDTVSTSYDSMEELIERQAAIEKLISKFLEKNNKADRTESKIRIHEKDGKMTYVLSINLIRDELRTAQTVS